MSLETLLPPSGLCPWRSYYLLENSIWFVSPENLLTSWELLLDCVPRKPISSLRTLSGLCLRRSYYLLEISVWFVSPEILLPSWELCLVCVSRDPITFLRTPSGLCLQRTYYLLENFIWFVSSENLLPPWELHLVCVPRKPGLLHCEGVLKGQVGSILVDPNSQIMKLSGNSHWCPLPPPPNHTKLKTDLKKCKNFNLKLPAIQLRAMNRN